MYRYPQTCTSEFCSRIECSGCRNLPSLNRYYLAQGRPGMVACSNCGATGADQAGTEPGVFHCAECTAGRRTERPDWATLRRWSIDGVAEALDGCPVEPDEHCEHGQPSWLVHLEVI